MGLKFETCLKHNKIRLGLKFGKSFRKIQHTIMEPVDEKR